MSQYYKKMKTKNYEKKRNHKYSPFSDIHDTHSTLSSTRPTVSLYGNDGTTSQLYNERNDNYLLDLERTILYIAIAGASR